MVYHAPPLELHALRDVTVTVRPGEIVGVIGESGCGKSTLANAALGLLPGNAEVRNGRVMLEGTDLVDLDDEGLRRIRGRRVALIPQDPLQSLNPTLTVGRQMADAVLAHAERRGRDRRELEQRMTTMLERVGIPDAAERLGRYPHEFSGGMRQRILIATALLLGPPMLVADEPTSALDVTVQRVILDHLESLTRELGTTLLFITHDLGLAAERAEQLVVMYKGRVVESGPSAQILQNPQHPYTQRLVAAAPSLASRRIQASGSIAAAESSMAEDASAAAGDAIDLIATAEARAEALEALASAPPAIVVENLTKVFKIRGSGDFTAVDDISFQIAKGTTTALVGESGSGKSTVAKMLLKLEDTTSGKIVVGGRDLASVTGKEMFELRSRMQPVFQDPYGSLNPLRNIGNTISEPLYTHMVGTRADRRARVYELLDQVSLPRTLVGRYPNELSGGQRQRIAIARALALKPEIVVLDEAVSALDVLVQAQILRLLADLQSELGLTYLFITHDLAVVRVIADHVSVMQRGRIVEKATTDEVFDNPKEQYTRDLLAAIPGAGIELGA